MNSQQNFVPGGNFSGRINNIGRSRGYLQSHMNNRAPIPSIGANLNYEADNLPYNDDICGIGTKSNSLQSGPSTNYSRPFGPRSPIATNSNPSAPPFFNRNNDFQSQNKRTWPNEVARQQQIAFDLGDQIDSHQFETERNVILQGNGRFTVVLRNDLKSKFRKRGQHNRQLVNSHFNQSREIENDNAFANYQHDNRSDPNHSAPQFGVGNRGRGRSSMRGRGRGRGSPNMDGATNDGRPGELVEADVGSAGTGRGGGSGRTDFSQEQRRRNTGGGSSHTRGRGRSRMRGSVDQVTPYYSNYNTNMAQHFPGPVLDPAGRGGSGYGRGSFYISPIRGGGYAGVGYAAGRGGLYSQNFRYLGTYRRTRARGWSSSRGNRVYSKSSGGTGDRGASRERSRKDAAGRSGSGGRIDGDLSKSDNDDDDLEDDNSASDNQQHRRRKKNQNRGGVDDDDDDDDDDDSKTDHSVHDDISQSNSTNLQKVASEEKHSSVANKDKSPSQIAVSSSDVVVQPKKIIEIPVGMIDAIKPNELIDATKSSSPIKSEKKLINAPQLSEIVLDSNKINSISTNSHKLANDENATSVATESSHTSTSKIENAEKKETNLSELSSTSAKTDDDTVKTKSTELPSTSVNKESNEQLPENDKDSKVTDEVKLSGENNS